METKDERVKAIKQYINNSLDPRYNPKLSLEDRITGICVVLIKLANLISVKDEKVSSCCKVKSITQKVMRADNGELIDVYYCSACKQSCQLVDEPVEPEHWIDRALYSSQLHTPKPAEPACSNCNGTGKVDIYNAKAELKDIPCPACQPVAQSSPNLDELMPLVDFIDDEVIAKCWLAPLYDGAKKQLAADKAITARLLAEKDTRIIGLESRIEGYKQYIKELVAEKDQTIKRVQGDYDLLAEEHRVYRDKIKELEAELAKLKAPFRDEVSGAWIDPCPKT